MCVNQGVTQSQMRQVETYC